MIRFLFDMTSDGGGSGPKRPVFAGDVPELRRHLKWLALVIVLGLCTMCGVLAAAWAHYG